MPKDSSSTHTPCPLRPGEPGAPTEYDEDGVPFYKWPPFPKPNSNKKIMPFKDFKASGIVFSIDDPDDIDERDGLGIPTVHLGVKHGEKSKKKKKKKAAPASTFPPNIPWYEHWAEGEELRSFTYDRKHEIKDRFLTAALNFEKSRKWPSRGLELDKMFEEIRLYTGISHNCRPIIPKYADEEPVLNPAEMPDSDFEEETLVLEKPSETSKTEEKSISDRTVEVMVGEVTNTRKGEGLSSESNDDFQVRYAKSEEKRDRRMDRFLTDPETTMKLFFSSHFRARGMIWSTLRLNYVPILAHFFVNFLIRNKALPECQKGLVKALAIVERAKIELPKTKKIGSALPDELAKSCVQLFGSKLRSHEWPEETKENETGAVAVREEPENPVEGNKENLQERPRKRVKTDEEPPLVASTMEVDTNTKGEENQKPTGTSSAAPTNPEGESEQQGVEGAEDKENGESSGWGDSAGWGTATGDWATLGKEEDQDSAWALPTHSLMTLLGPTSLPLTHTTGYVEYSTRRIVSWEMPSEDSNEGKGKGKAQIQPSKGSKELEHMSNSDPFKRFVKLVLSPYDNFAKNSQKGAIHRPELIEDPHSSTYSGSATAATKENIPIHNPYNDQITVLLAPEAALELYEGMGLGGTWVQVLPVSSLATEKNEAWWYAEYVEQVIPSFWTEPPGW